MKDSASSPKETISSLLALHMSIKFFSSLMDCIRNIFQKFPSLEEAQYKNRKYDIFEKMRVKTIPRKSEKLS